jgi:serine/threonine protein kinase
LLGQGGFGSVYKTKINGKAFAVKKLFACDEGILQEISIHQELKHENVVLLDSAFFDSEKMLNIVMELCM